jgi:cytochrome b561
MSLLTLLEIFKTLGWIDRIVHALRPLLRTFGLSDKAGILWMTAVVFGLAYGAAVIVEEAKEGYLSREELEVLHLSIGINHSLVEDPALFLSFGLSALWLWVPRIITAVIAVRLFTWWQRSVKTRLFGKS